MSTPFFRIPRRLQGVWLSGLLLLAACSAVGPAYSPPEAGAPAAWTTPLEDGLDGEAADPVALAEWWSLLEDPQLIPLVEKTLEANPDLEAATARLRRARALLALRRGDRRPSLDASGSATYIGNSEELGGGEIGSGVETELYRVGFDASWELDLFGGIRRSVEAAAADAEAAAEDLASVRVSLAAEVAGAYVDLRTFQARLAFAEANREAQQETYDIAHSRFEAGLVGRLDVEQARSNLESTRSQIPVLRVGIERSANRLAVLQGEAPGALRERLTAAAPIPGPPTSVAVGIPAEALRRRPDVRASERRLAAETARVGVATAELYPRLRLGGSIGLEALDLDRLGKGSAAFFGIGPSFSWRIFDRRAVRAGIEVQDATREEALAIYQGTVLFALEEVDDALLAFAQEELRRRALESAAGAAERAADLARDLYRSGLRTFQEVLDSQRSLLTFQDQLAVSQGAVTTHLIRLYKALGGGWTPRSEAAGASP